MTAGASALRLRRDSQPTVQKLTASAFRLSRLQNRLGVHLTVEVAKQLGFVVTYRRRVLPQIAGTEDTAGELLELFGFNGAEEPQTDLGRIRNLFN